MENEEKAEGTVVSQSTKTTSRLAEGKSIICPECGIPNPVSRMTCEICHARLRPKPPKEEMKMDEMARELYGMNKKLKQAMTAGDQKLCAKIRAQIKAAAAKSEGIFKVGESGLATQAKSTASKTPKAPKAPKKVRNCPCCGKQVNGFFAMGHDGRVHGMLIKIGLGKIKINEAPKGVQAMFPIWNKDHSLSMKEVAGRLEK